MQRSHTTFCALRVASESSFEFSLCRSINAEPADARTKIEQRQMIAKTLTNSDIFRDGVCA